MKLLGLIGYPLGHSFSAGYFKRKFESQQIKGFRYVNFPLETIAELPRLIRNETDLVGLNVTIPHKQSVMDYLDGLDELSEGVGAVNTIKINRAADGVSTRGYNTDVYGFYHSLRPLLKQTQNRAMILGTGGASRAVAYTLAEMSIDYVCVSRDPGRGMLSYADICHSLMDQYNIIINTTPLGTYPDVENFPEIPYDLLSSEHILFDLVYNPPETKFMQLGKARGATTVNGHKMLELQAEKSWEIWNTEGREVSMI